MPKAKVISPFYDDSVNAPPPFPSMLTDQLELFGDSLPPSSLLANEVLPSKRAHSAPPQRPFIVKSHIAASSKSRQTPPVSSNSGRTAQSPYPPVKARQRSRALSESPSELSSVTSTSTTSTSTSDNESTSGSALEDSKVPKPPGEPGRPGRGGYNLEATLDWNHKAYNKFKDFTHKLIDEHLDTAKCASAQDPALLKLVREKTRAAFPDLAIYQNCWPVSDMIMMRLKYTSSRARRHESETTKVKVGTNTGKEAGRATVKAKRTSKKASRNLPVLRAVH